MERAAGVKLFMVLGHEACDDVKLGNLTRLLSKINPTIDSVEGYDGEHSSKNKEFVDKVIEANVSQTMTNIRKRSDLLASM